MASAKIGVSLGTMAFARRMTQIECQELVTTYVSKGYKELDTALMYWGSEEVLGSIKECQAATKVTHIATKANPNEDFSRQGVVAQLNKSLSSLGLEQVDLFYLHWPDHSIPIEETLEGVDQLYREGKFKEFGLSNYASWQVVEIWHICKAKGYILPTVYQGMYNALTRRCEDELFPALRKYGIRFYVYNPLAGGLLTGKYNYSDKDDKKPAGRFFGVNEKWGLAYQNRYWHKESFAAIEDIKKKLDESYGKGVMGILEASLRWLVHHSQLAQARGDAIIVGCSKSPHVVANLKAIEGDPLNQDVVDAFEAAWNSVSGNVPKYFR